MSGDIYLWLFQRGHLQTPLVLHIFYTKHVTYCMAKSLDSSRWAAMWFAPAAKMTGPAKQPYFGLCDSMKLYQKLNGIHISVTIVCGGVWPPTFLTSPLFEILLISQLNPPYITTFNLVKKIAPTLPVLF